MGANIGSQEVNILYHTPGVSSQMNLRQFGISPTGIHSGGWLSIVDATHAQISALICEITDGSYNVRVRMQDAVSVLIGSSTPYVVLRWTYTGSATDDYMEPTAVATPGDNDLVVGYCTFSGGGALNGFTYTSRSNPSVKDLFLKVEETGDSDLRVRIRGGYFQGGSSSILVSDQKSDLFTPPTSNSKVYLVYINESDGTVKIDSTGTAAASPVAPSYAGKLVIAEVTLASTDTSIAQDKIVDVRPFITSGPRGVDDSTIEVNNSGNLKVVDPYYMLTRTIGHQLSGNTTWTALANYGTVIGSSGITVASGGIFTLPAGRLYEIAYTVMFQRISASPEVRVRYHVLSGDLNWWLADDEDNQSIARCEIENVSLAHNTLSFTGLILPTKNTTLRCEVITKDATGADAHVWAATLVMIGR